MANSSQSDEHNQLRRRAKRRLLGAVILVTGLVVFLPMVLDDEPKPVSDDIAISIPSQDGKGIVVPAPKNVPNEDPPPAKAAPEKPIEPKMAEPPEAKQAVQAPPVQALTVLPGGQSVPPVTATEPKPAAVKNDPAKPTVPAEKPKPSIAAADTHKEPAPPSEAKSVEAAKPVAKSEQPKPAAKPEPAKEVKATAKPSGAPPQSGFVVRLGAFAKPENAKQLKAKLTSLGIRNYSDVMKTPSGDKHRVRAGPFTTRKEAETARDRLKAANLVGDVVPKT